MATSEVHDLEPHEFLEEVHSFDFWFQAVEGYLTGLTDGHRPDTADARLTPGERDRLVTVLSNHAVGETAAEEERLARAYLESVERLGVTT